MDQQTTRTTFISILAAVQSYRQKKDTETPRQLCSSCKGQKLRQVDTEKQGSDFRDQKRSVVGLIDNE